MAVFYFGSRYLGISNAWVKGFLYDQEAARLLSHTMVLPRDSVVVELGSFCGKSAVWLALGALISDSRVHCIDPFDGPHYHSSDVRLSRSQDPVLSGDFSATFFTTLELRFPPELRAHLTAHRQTGSEAARDWKEPVDFVFVDGEHRRCWQDVEEWLPHLRPWAMVALHDVDGTGDYGKNGPDATATTLLRGGEWKVVSRDATLVCLSRDPDWWRVRTETWNGGCRDVTEKVCGVTTEEASTPVVGQDTPLPPRSVDGVGSHSRTSS